MPKNTSQIAIKLPQTREETADLIQRYKQIEMQIDTAQAHCNKIVQKAEARLEDTVASLRQELEATGSAIQSFCASRRDEITDNGKRSYSNFTTGRVGWRKGKMIIAVADGQTEAVIEALDAAGLSDCLKVKMTLDKSALLKLPEDTLADIDGLSKVKKPEVFYIKPNEIVADRAPEGEAA